MAKRVLVTGSSRGIGKAIAIRLARAGFEITLHCRKQRDQTEQVKKLITTLSPNTKILQFDVASREQCHELLVKDIEKNGAYYGVVLNAGLAHDQAFPSLSERDWSQVIHTNLDGFYNVLHPLVMPMIRTRLGGRIVTMASASGVVGNRGQTNYAASKGGLIAASKSLSIELAKRKITVNCVAPGFIETDMLNDAPLDEALKLIPARRAGTPDEVAELVNYLFSDMAGYVTRQVISINGGMY